MTSNNGRSGTQTVERALAILKAVGARTTTGATLAEVMHTVRLNRTTVYRLLRCLVREGAVRIADDDRYFLGPLLLDMGSTARQHENMKARLSPTLSRIADATGDTVFLQLRTGGESVCVDRRLGAYPVKTLIVDVGTRRPLGVGAAGLAILAASPPEEAQRIIEANAAQFLLCDTSATSVTKAVRAAQRLGYVSAPVFGVPGVIAIALAITDEKGNAVAAIAVAAITQRMSRARQAELVKTVRAELSRAANGLRPPRPQR